jgi:NAD(P)-dependent dehydrogenase (short-subunit alcohol dehydrogenase family)
MWWGKRHPPADPKHLSFKGKTVLVTGANSGLGHETAVKFAALGASTLILGVRTQEKGEQAKADIIKKTQCSPGIFIIETVDLSTFASVREFVSRVKARVPKLDIASLNAGVAEWKYVKSPDGYEMTLQINVLSPALMAMLLLPKLRETATATSKDDDFSPYMFFLLCIAAWEVEADWLLPGQSLIQRCNDESKWATIKQYFLAKLALWHFIQGLVEREEKEGKGVNINANCPGLCKTSMSRNFPLIIRLITLLQYFFVGRTAKEEARTMVGATCLGRESMGKPWRNDQYIPPSKLMESERGTELYHETYEEIMAILRQHVSLEELI